METIKYEQRVVAFIDILGFKEIIKNSNIDLEKVQLIFDVLNWFKSFEQPESWSSEFVEIEESAQLKDVKKFNVENDIVCTSFSDSILISLKISDDNINELVSNLVSNLSFIGSILFQTGILWRGGISLGNLYHNSNGIVFGDGLIKSYELESKLAIFPRIILSKDLISKLNYPYYSKRERYPYHNYLERFEDGCVGFHQLKFAEAMTQFLNDDEKLISLLNKYKKTIIDGLDANFETPDIYLKFKWLKDTYNKLYILNNNKTIIPNLNDNIVGNNIHFKYTDDYISEK